MHTDEITLWVPQSEEDKELVRRQMNRLLETSHFRNSRRYPALFRFIIEETLAGRGEFLKERLLGVHVFGRPADYDTAADPVVRVTVAEIRKRIAQYYHDEAHDHELRIELLPGSYEPEFRPSRFDPGAQNGHSPHMAESLTDSSAIESHGPEATSLTHAVPAAEISAAQSSRKRSLRIWYSLLAVAMLAGSVLGYTTWISLRPTAVDDLWGPVLAAHRTITFCIPVAGGKYGPGLAARHGADPTAIASDPTATFLAHESLGENVVYSDMLAMTRISNLLALKHGDMRYRLNVSTSLDDLRQGPSVLIGGMDNQWTLRALSHLRYQFGGNDQESYWIVDTKTGQPMPWGLDTKTHIAAVNRDYALIARVHDEDTGQVEMIVAGIGMSGTAAAGELLVNPQMVNDLKRRIGPGFRDHDFEAVLSTDVVNGMAGAAKILAINVQ